MFYSKCSIVITVLLCLSSEWTALGNDVLKSEVLLARHSLLTRQGFGIKQEIDEELCELQWSTDETIALTFLDASGKVPSGILMGNSNSYGEYYQCLSVNETVDNIHIKGKYCMVSYAFFIDETEVSAPLITKTQQRGAPSVEGMSVSGMVGVCVPSACNSTDYLNVLSDIPGVTVLSQELYCREANDKPLKTEDLVAIIVFSILGLILVISTWYDLYNKALSRDGISILTSFSVHRNMCRLTKIPNAGNPLSCINGIRTISIIWIMIGHCYTTALLIPVVNFLDVFTWIDKFTTLWVLSSTLAVDTFFFVAAFLLTWSVLKKFKKTGDFIKSIPMLYLNRYLRLTPLLAGVILLQVSFFNHVSDGPDWRPVSGAANNCLHSWWVTLLYVQNYLRYENICIDQTWYLAVDMQLYLVSPLVIAFLFSGKKWAFGALAIATLAALSISLGICLYHQFGVIVSMESVLQPDDFVQLYYYNTLARASPFVLGIFTAYIVTTQLKSPKLVSNKFYIYLHWLITAGFLAAPFFGTYTVVQHESSQLTVDFYNGWHRAAWAIGVGGIIVACAKGIGGPINWFLGHNIWVIPARMSYAMYLIHLAIMYSVVGSTTAPVRFSDYSVLFRFFGDICLTILISLVLILSIEAPCQTLTNALLAKFAGKKGSGDSKLKTNDAASNTMKSEDTESADHGSHFQENNKRNQD